MLGVVVVEDLLHMDLDFADEARSVAEDDDDVVVRVAAAVEHRVLETILEADNANTVALVRDVVFIQALHHRLEVIFVIDDDRRPYDVDESTHVSVVFVQSLLRGSFAKFRRHGRVDGIILVVVAVDRNLEHESIRVEADGANELATKRVENRFRFRSSIVQGVELLLERHAFGDELLNRGIGRRDVLELIHGIPSQDIAHDTLDQSLDLDGHVEVVPELSRFWSYFEKWINDSHDLLLAADHGAAGRKRARRRTETGGVHPSVCVLRIWGAIRVHSRGSTGTLFSARSTRPMGD
mmetsp:Transcript_22401/g.70155  ORF Transcript_22401/g.70155 Transcript_22401/m.70155 type:complete len:295 (+) Transcript_22401:344-1228(+)